MADSWPGALSAFYPHSKPLQAAVQNIVQSTETDFGRIRTRKRFSVPILGPYSITIGPLTLSQKSTLHTFFNTTQGGGAGEFLWYQPDHPDTTVTMKFVGGSLNYRTFGGRTDLWYADFAVLVLPS